MKIGGEIFAVHVLHGDEALPTSLSDVVHATNVGVGNPPGHAHFFAEAAQSLGVSGHLLGKKLQSNGLAEVEIVGS